MMHLLDTNIISLAMSGEAAVVRHLAAMQAGEAAMSAVTYAEIAFGLARSAGLQRKKDLFERLLEHVEVLPWDLDAAIAYAGERVACEMDGQSLHHADLMILAHAGSTGRTLVSRDAALQRRDRKGPHKTRVVGW
jgi:tRNA(fMet)-specific endonuclease VapC